MIIGVIGGGASGMAAALAAAENKENTVVLFERQARVGRKLLATGNGRCNLSNQKPAAYHGAAPEFADGALGAFSVDETLRWFRDMGLLTVTEDGGRVYPYSDQANSVVDVLRFAMEKAGIVQKLGFEVTKIQQSNQGFMVHSREEQVYCDRLIIACGGLAGTKLGGSMSGYQLLRSLGHRVTKLRPALVQMKVKDSFVSALKGVRTNCAAQIYHNGSLFSQSVGEIQFTDYGLSGPVIFEISRDACQGSGDWICRLDFLPDLTQQEVMDLICRNGEQMLTGILHNRLGKILAKAGEYDKKQVSSLVKCFEFTLDEPMGMDCAQVTAGGIITDEFDANTMESRLVPGLYACGEVLDIDGDCGGYNLQWAWSSGRLAGICAGRAE